jgi:hypothetical protein
MINLKQSIQAAVPNWKGDLLVHVMGWFGDGKVHRVNRYTSNNPGVIAKQLNAMEAIGIDGIVLTWQGPTVNPFLHNTAIKLWEGCMERQMLFALLLDPWIAKNQPNPTQAVITALQSADCQMILASPAYLLEDYILEFDLANSAGVNIQTVQAAIPDIPLLSWHTGFSWPNIGANPSNPTDSLATLKADNAKPTMKVAGVNIGFNDAGSPLPVGATPSNFLGVRNYGTSVWGGPPRVIDHQAGNWFYDQLAVIPSSVPYISLVTWNDHDEGTGIEQVIAALTGVRIGI